MLNSGIKKMLNQNAEFASLLKKTPLQLKCQIDPISIPKVKVYFHYANQIIKQNFQLIPWKMLKPSFTLSVNSKALSNATISMARIPLHSTMKCSLEQLMEVGMPP